MCSCVTTLMSYFIFYPLTSFFSYIFHDNFSLTTFYWCVDFNSRILLTHWINRNEKWSSEKENGNFILIQKQYTGNKHQVRSNQPGEHIEKIQIAHTEKCLWFFLSIFSNLKGVWELFKKLDFDLSGFSQKKNMQICLFIY